MTATAKQIVRDVLDHMPDDCSLDDVQHQIHVRKKLDESARAAAEGRVVSHDEVKTRLARWLAK